MSARQIWSPSGSINRTAFGLTEARALMLVATLARIDFASAKFAALNSLVLSKTKSPGHPPDARSSYFQTLADLLANNLISRWLSFFGSRESPSDRANRGHGATPLVVVQGC